MGQVTIRLTINRETGTRDVVIELSDDAQLTHWEHEQAHQAIVERLLGQGLLARDELGELRVTRVHAPAAQETATADREAPARDEPLRDEPPMFEPPMADRQPERTGS